MRKSAAVSALILALLLSASLAGGQRRFLDEQSLQRQGKEESGDEKPWNGDEEEEEVGAVHGRMLKVKTNDYGRYDPSPSLDKPPSKLIPN